MRGWAMTSRCLLLTRRIGLWIAKFLTPRQVTSSSREWWQPPEAKKQDAWMTSACSRTLRTRSTSPTLGSPQLTQKWVDVNIGPRQDPVVRSRLVARDFKPKGVTREGLGRGFLLENRPLLSSATREVTSVASSSGPISHFLRSRISSEKTRRLCGTTTAS